MADASLEGMPEFGKEEIPLVVPDTSRPAHLCIATKKNGQPCGFPKSRGTDYCVPHDPGISKEQRAEWSSKKRGHTYKQRSRAKTKQELLEILSDRFDKFLERFGGMVAPEIEETICEMARTYVTVLKTETAGEDDKSVKGWRMRGTA